MGRFALLALLGGLVACSKSGDSGPPPPSCTAHAAEARCPSVGDQLKIGGDVDRVNLS